MNPTQHLVQNRSTQLIFRDCLKLASRMVRQQEKIAAIRKLVRKQFQRHRQVFDQDQIKALKMNAVKGISNYIIHTVQMDYNLNKKKPINIMDEQQNERAEQQQENLEQRHFNQEPHNTINNSDNQKFNQVK